MRNAVISGTFLLSVLAAANTDEVYAPFDEPTFAILEDVSADTHDISPMRELLRRQNGCDSGYTNCGNLGAAGACCRPNQVCSADSQGHVGCCPIGAACTGSLGGSAPTAGSSSPTFIFPSGTAATTTQGFSVGDPTGVSDAPYSYSTVSNQYYPILYIPTTYTNAAACSSAYSSLQTAVASCTAALAGGANGVTINAPNGGITVAPITASLDLPQASSVCSSLSSRAGFGLVVEACGNFGNGGSGAAGKNCKGSIYGIGAGLAVGVAGQML
ncbi:hypothetical protein EJ05DRAFT_189099 [Pseudovirgaria hyperparasitica]|uniref:GPI anchored protein n=1 Tax=Pseudovirgaria hyperparasitica TaxID=470096 RepID=A0A6A6WIM6_9PEZI|nr:uncharacterized protein EJ05DRAFT_189099 [Pseudovirgaria hyperparasitica]KAF2761920.1 hypothetical protein EJ05DRAFT_189099 [Pseudovirgaria hyperparasitica]